MKRLFIAAMAALVLMNSPAPVSAQGCTDPEQLLAMTPAGTTNRVIIGDEAVTWLDGFNSIPPVTDLQADTLVILKLPDGSVFLALFVDGCGTKIGRIPEGLIQRVQDIIGEAS